MVAIRKLLDQHAPDRIEDRNLAWGAKRSHYRDALLASLRRGETPVLIELEDDLPEDAFDRQCAVVVDHHGPRAGADRPTSIEQVFELLALPADEWTRQLSLVAANDRAHVEGMKRLGASPDEIMAVRVADRAAQGVTAWDETEAIRAIADRRQEGRLTLVETTGTTSSAIADRMLPELGGPGYRRLLVRMPEEVAVFADGEPILRLGAMYPGSWWGGDLPKAGFWGMALPSGRDKTLFELIETLR